LMIVLVQLGAVKIYSTAVEALRKKERQDETQITTKIDGFVVSFPRSGKRKDRMKLSLPPKLMVLLSVFRAQEKGKTG
jgi:hypothetical protein